MLLVSFICASHYLDAVPVETHKLTLARHRVSSGSVVRASDKIMEGCGFKSHLGLGFVSEFTFLLTFNIMLLLLYSIYFLSKSFKVSQNEG